jgi:hypothetical protein
MRRTTGSDARSVLPLFAAELLALVDRPMLWCGVNGVARSLREGLLRAAQVSAKGQTPSPLRSPDGVVVVHRPQMLRLWKRLGLVG